VVYLKKIEFVEDTSAKRVEFDFEFEFEFEFELVEFELDTQPIE
tara:strand:+ start:113 stop:244 length:132 start_codon:yes stop_codon:yes gene_type:complete